MLKFATLIKIESIETNIKDWCNSKQILATNYITSTDVNLLISIQNFYSDVINCDSKFSMLKIIEKVYKLFKLECYQIVTNIVTFVIVNNLMTQEKAIKSLEYLNLSKSYPPSTDQIVINGNMLMLKWKIKGQNIKLVKDTILDKIFSDEIVNTTECLEPFITEFVNIFISAII